MCQKKNIENPERITARFWVLEASSQKEQDVEVNSGSVCEIRAPICFSRNQDAITTVLYPPSDQGHFDGNLVCQVSNHLEKQKSLSWAISTQPKGTFGCGLCMFPVQSLVLVLGLRIICFHTRTQGTLRTRKTFDQIPAFLGLLCVPQEIGHFS